MSKVTKTFEALDELAARARESVRSPEVHETISRLEKIIRDELPRETDAFSEAQKGYLKWRAYALADEHYKTEPLSETWMNWRGFCGCGDSAVMLGLVRDALEACDRKDFGLQSFRDVTQDEARWMLLYVLDQLGLTEHGTSVRGSWPTEDGKVFLGDAARELAP